MPLPPPKTPPAVVAPAPADGPGAEAALLEAFDWGYSLPPEPRLQGSAALSYRWLRSAATFDPVRGVPASPFGAGSRHREAEALRRLLSAPGDGVGAALKALPIRESGTALALWRWGRLRARNGTFSAALRRAWEDRLLRAGPGLTRGYGLRHALCWALADRDEARFADLRTLAGGDSGDLLMGFQRLLGILGGPSPVLRLWSLPQLDYQDLRLDQLGGSRIWISPAEEGSLAEVPGGTVRIVPSLTGALDERAASLTEDLLAEGRALGASLGAGARSAWFAPSRAAFGQLGLVWFPILIQLDADGQVQSVRMGDAAPGAP